MKVENFNPNETPYIKGDTVLSISPYDSFQLFTIYKDNTSGVPVDLTNCGVLYLNFTGSKGDVIIPNYTNVDNIDIVNGQVLFKISKEDARTILNLDNNNFYITSKKKIGDTYSEDETVLFQGQWSSYTDSAQTSISSIVSQQADRIAELENTNAQLLQTIEELTRTNVSLENTIKENNSTINILNNELKKFNSMETVEYIDLSNIDTDNMTEEELQKMISGLSKNY